MKKIVLIGVLLFCAAGLWAQSEDVFEAGNMEFGGEFHLTYLPDAYITDAEDREDQKGEYWLLIDASGNIGIFLLDNLSLQFMPGVLYTRRKNNQGDDIDNGLMLTLKVGCDYYLRTSSPWTFSGGLDTGISFLPGIDGIDSGTDDPDDSLTLIYEINPNISAYYFISERMAPYVTLCTEFFNNYRVKNDAGDSYDYTDGRTFMERWQMQLKVSIGFKYFLPTEFRFLSGEETKYTEIFKFGT